MKYRLRWAKFGKLRFVSHHDEALIFERSIRRAGLPLAYSEGFTPHPKIAFGSGLPLGYGSEVELLDVGLTEEMDPAELVHRFNAGLPHGFEMKAGRRRPQGQPSLGAVIEAADYEIHLGASWLDEALSSFLAAEKYEITRRYKGSTRVDDLRPGVLAAVAEDGLLRLRTTIKPRSTRPSDVLSALASLAGGTLGPATYQRTALLTSVDGGWAWLSEDPEPISAPDRPTPLQRQEVRAS